MGMSMSALASASALESLRAAGASLFAQHARLLRLRFAANARIDGEMLLPHRIHGEEGLSANYRYVLDCLSPDAGLELKALLGQPVEVGLLLPDGGERLYSGLVTRVEQRGADGGFGLFTLTIEPALALLAHRRNSRVFQDKTVPEIVKAILQEHQSSNPAFSHSFLLRDDTVLKYPQRSYCLQYREADLAFIERLLAEEGIAWRYAHGGGEGGSRNGPSGSATSLVRSGAAEADGVPTHTLVLFDDSAVLPVLTGEHELGRTGRTRPAGIRFHRTAGVERDDGMDVWLGERQIDSGRTTLLAYDYKAVDAHLGSAEASILQGDAGDSCCAGLEDYDPQTLYYGQDPREMSRYAALRQQARDRQGKVFNGEGSARCLAAGGWFPLADHPLHDQDSEEDRQFLVTRLSFAARNNLLPETEDPFPLPAGSLLEGKDGNSKGQSATPYRARMEAIRRHIRFVPDYNRSAHRKPTAPGGTTATVVGPDGEEIHTDQHGRIKLQFHWQRREDHPDGGADLDERSSTWVRVAYPSAGAAWGTQYIPRIGQEVLVSFLENDIDRPVVTGVLYNGTHRPPEFSAAGRLPANRMLSGHRSKEHKGQGWNELVFDDSTGELRTRLSSEHGKTQLNQGYLIHPRTDGKGEVRGEGFELRSDKHGAIRAGQGLFLTTEAQAGASGRQLSRDHAQAQLEAAYQLTKNLAEVATKQAADALEHGPEQVSTDNQPEGKTQSGHLDHHVQALRAWEAGSNTDKDGKTAKEEPGRQPIMVMSAPAGIAGVTGQNLSLTAGTNLDFTAQRDSNQSSGRRWLHNVGQHISLFVNGVKGKIAMKLIAAQGKVQIQAQHGEAEMTAEQDLSITSTQGKVLVVGRKEILLTSGGGYIRLKDGDIEIHCPGTVSIRGKAHTFNGPDAMHVGHPAFPENLPKAPLIFNFDHAPQGVGGGWARMPYKLFADGAPIKEGVLDGTGPLQVDHEVVTREYQLELANGMIYKIPVASQYSNASQGEGANGGIHKHEAGAPADTGATPQPATPREDYAEILYGSVVKGG